MNFLTAFIQAERTSRACSYAEGQWVWQLNEDNWVVVRINDDGYTYVTNDDDNESELTKVSQLKALLRY